MSGCSPLGVLSHGRVLILHLTRLRGFRRTGGYMTLSGKEMTGTGLWRWPITSASPSAFGFMDTSTIYHDGTTRPTSFCFHRSVRDSVSWLLRQWRMECLALRFALMERTT